MTLDLDAIRAAAKAATPGPWVVSPTLGDRYGAVVSPSGPTGFDDDENVRAYGGHIIGESISVANRDYLVACNPAVILEMVEELRWAEGFRAGRSR